MRFNPSRLPHEKRKYQQRMTHRHLTNNMIKAGAVIVIKNFFL